MDQSGEARVPKALFEPPQIIFQPVDQSTPEASSSGERDDTAVGRRRRRRRTSHDTDATRLIVPMITDDATEGHQDMLGVDSDARALAALIASCRLEPPLAIGLYGPWGSGKTYFMKRVQASVEDLATSDRGEAFYSGIEHVWFSAWHYQQGNLWASLLHHIFNSLTRDESRRQLVLNELLAKVQGARQVRSALAEQVEAAADRLDGATRAVDAAMERHGKAVYESSQLRAKDLWDAVKLSASDQHLKDQVVKAADDLGLTVVADSAQDLAQTAGQVIGLASRARVLATAGRWYRSPLAFALYAAVIVGSLGLLLGALVHSTHPWMGTAITAIAQLAAVGSATAGWLIRQRDLARRLISPAETLQRRLGQRLAEQQTKNERELAALEQEADAAKTELAVAVQQHAAAEQQLASIEREQGELTGKRLLRRYLAERASSGDYEHYMGVVALAHRDLRALEDYFQASINDSNSTDKGLDRIVLYIDDLDRCEPDVVGEVLDAVHLLLALRLFVVIVGVDPRWLERSLRERHSILLESMPSTETPWTSPTDYLEKIFQLTYTLLPMNAGSCGDLLVAAARGSQAVPASQDQHPGNIINRLENAADTEKATSRRPSQASSEFLAEALILHEKDIQALREVAPLVSRSPRRAKRFLNIYLVIRARALGDSIMRRRLIGNGDVPSATQDKALLVLVALLMGLPKIMAGSISEQQYPDADHKGTLGKWLLKATQDIPDEQCRLQEFLSAKPSMLALPIDAVMQWLPLVRPYLPFSFEQLQHSGPGDTSTHSGSNQPHGT